MPGTGSLHQSVTHRDHQQPDARSDDPPTDLTEAGDPDLEVHRPAHRVTFGRTQLRPHQIGAWFLRTGQHPGGGLPPARHLDRFDLLQFQSAAPPRVHVHIHRDGLVQIVTHRHREPALILRERHRPRRDDGHAGVVRRGEYVGHLGGQAVPLPWLRSPGHRSGPQELPVHRATLHPGLGEQPEITVRLPVQLLQLRHQIAAELLFPLPGRVDQLTAVHRRPIAEQRRSGELAQPRELAVGDGAEEFVGPGTVPVPRQRGHHSAGLVRRAIPHRYQRSLRQQPLPALQPALAAARPAAQQARVGYQAGQRTLVGGQRNHRFGVGLPVRNRAGAQQHRAAAALGHRGEQLVGREAVTRPAQLGTAGVELLGGSVRLLDRRRIPVGQAMPLQRGQIGVPVRQHQRVRGGEQATRLVQEHPGRRRPGPPVRFPVRIVAGPSVTLLGDPGQLQQRGIHQVTQPVLGTDVQQPVQPAVRREQLAGPFATAVQQGLIVGKPGRRGQRQQISHLHRGQVHVPAFLAVPYPRHEYPLGPGVPNPGPFRIATYVHPGHVGTRRVHPEPDQVRHVDPYLEVVPLARLQFVGDVHHQRLRVGEPGAGDHAQAGAVPGSDLADRLSRGQRAFTDPQRDLHLLEWHLAGVPHLAGRGDLIGAAGHHRGDRLQLDVHLRFLRVRSRNRHHGEPTHGGRQQHRERRPCAEPLEHGAQVRRLPPRRVG